MKKRVFSIVLAFAMCFALTATAFAKETSWNYGNYNHGTYVPLKGTFSNSLSKDDTYGNIMITNVEFTLDQTNVESILAYNKGEGAHANTKGKKCYLTLDVTSVRDSGTFGLDPFDGYAIISNLPNWKADLENDDPFGGRYEESEVVALGEVKASTNYWMTTYWDDYRGSDNDTGKFQAQFAMSAKGYSDYNNVIQSDVIQGIITYGGYAGKYSFPANPTPFNENSNAVAESSLIPATITFAQKLSISELATYCSNHNIEIAQLQARGLDAQGERVTFCSKTTKGLTETDELLREWAADADVEYLGIVSAYVYLDSKDIQNIENDPLTYYLEIGESISAATSEGCSTVSFPHSLAWKLEDMERAK